MFEIVYALLYSGAIYFSMAGMLPATYVLLALTSFHLASVVFISSMLIGTIHKISLDKDDRTPFPTSKMPMKFLFQVFITISAYHLYTIGYIEFASMLFISIVIAFAALCISAFLADRTESN
jgi:hypothetical protein